VTLSKVTRSEILPGRRIQGRLLGGHLVGIVALTRPTVVRCLLGPGGGRITQGYGKWDEVAVPRGTPFTQWTGRGLYGMDLDLLLDGWAKHRSVEPQVTSIEQLALLPTIRPMGKTLVTPPPVRLFGAVPHPELTWVVSGIDWGDSLRDPRNGHRLRQGLTLHLLEYVEETSISALPPPPPPPRKYKVKHGDNLKHIAAKMLGKSSRWRDIAKLNKGLRGGRLPHKWVGKTILIPPH
jgi:hypothetical protein